ncbi:MAG: FAD-dependent oxidoreductase [Tannerella sp.]|jgi:hypothetical protein|nr:FAD-dependent oxidoreductase [Tannerella sp.]
MNRRNFIGYGLAGGIASALPYSLSANSNISSKTEVEALNAVETLKAKEMKADVVIAGGSLGGCAAAIAALRNGLKIIMTEETDWLGGQLTSQGVPPDEHPWIETHGAPASYRTFRTAVRDIYRRTYPLTEAAKERRYLNPGGGSVSVLCHEPRVALAALYDIFNPYISAGKMTLLLEYKAVAADVTGDKVQALKVRSLKSGNELILNAPYFIDATELGDLLHLTGTEYVTGAEAQKDTGEMHAAEHADPANQQAFTVCFAVDNIPGANNIIDKPKSYNFWRNHIPALTPAWSGKLLDLTYSNPSTLEPKKLGFNPDGKSIDGGILNLWNYRRIIYKDNFLSGCYDSDICLVNWPQNDYALGNLDGKDFAKHFIKGKELSLSLLYWLQTECPRPDGGTGWSGLRLRGDIMGTDDGMAKYPYVREARRIKALFTVLEEHVGKEQRIAVSGEATAAKFYDSVGTGYYHIDLHPSTKGNNYIDFPSLPFQLPLGAFIPQRMENLLPACKNIGTTHITNGCYRLHPVEWSIGEAVGCLTAYALKHQTTPRAVRETPPRLADFQTSIRSQGLEPEWPA